MQEPGTPRQRARDLGRAMAPGEEEKMVWELLAVVFAGIAGAGVMHLIARLTKMPRWMVPVGAGVAMLAATISSEYGWYSRSVANLPDGVVVADSVAERVFYRPWTYAVPMKTRFAAVDLRKLQHNAETPGLYMTEVYLFGRWRATTSVQMMVDCEGMRRADPAMGDGSAPVWHAVGPDDAIVKTTCEGR